MRSPNRSLLFLRAQAITLRIPLSRPQRVKWGFIASEDEVEVLEPVQLLGAKLYQVNDSGLVGTGPRKTSLPLTIRVASPERSSPCRPKLTSRRFVSEV